MFGKHSSGSCRKRSELAHVLTIEGFKSDFGDEQAGKDNDKLVDKNCGKRIKGLKWSPIVVVPDSFLALLLPHPQGEPQIPPLCSSSRLVSITCPLTVPIQLPDLGSLVLTNLRNG